MTKENPSTQAPISENPADLNWLDLPGWRTIPYPTDDDERRQIERAIRFYVRGCLRMYNATKRPTPNPPYVVIRVLFERNTANPSTCTVRAFLHPFVTEIPEGDPEEGGGHLIPQEPPPPDDFE